MKYSLPELKKRPGVYRDRSRRSLVCKKMNKMRVSDTLWKNYVLVGESSWVIFLLYAWKFPFRPEIPLWQSSKSGFIFMSRPQDTVTFNVIVPLCIPSEWLKLWIITSMESTKGQYESKLRWSVPTCEDHMCVGVDLRSRSRWDVCALYNVKVIFGRNFLI